MVLTVAWRRGFSTARIWSKRFHRALSSNYPTMATGCVTAEAKEFDRSVFDETIKVFGVAMLPVHLGSIVRDCKGFILRVRSSKNVVPAPDASNREKAILFDPEAVSSRVDLLRALQSNPEALARLEASNARDIEYHVKIGYTDCSVEKVLRKLLPASITELPSSFEMAGHVAHVNLREECLPYRYIIGQVLLEKNNHLETVVNKVGIISNEFRTFPMEVIAGKDDLNVEVREYGARFRFNFAKVYWNSRLQDEHRRLVDRFNSGSVIVDAFCGVGPFAVPAGLKGCTVHASDLNPESYAALVKNVALNHVENKVSTSNKDARDFLRETLGRKDVLADHMIMNLPASAIEFLDALKGAFDPTRYRAEAGAPSDAAGDAEHCHKKAKTQEESQLAGQTERQVLPMIHCYCFANPETFRADILERASTAMGCSLEALRGAEIRQVRDVAPKKVMYCLHVRVPAEIAFPR